MSKGYTVYPLMHQPQETVINEALIRQCIYFSSVRSTDEERLRFVSAREEVQRKQRAKNAMETMELRKVATLLLSYQRIGKIDNLVGLCNLTKLVLDNNLITAIENISHLKKLQWLDLSFNQITEITGLEELVELETLSLFSNKISVVQGLDTLKKLTSLSVGNNNIELLEDTARYLHRISSLRVLTLKGNRVEKQPMYRVRLLAFVPKLQFLDGCVVYEGEVARAREEQREHLMPIDEEDQRIANELKMEQEAERTRLDYERFNCPDETKLYDSLFRLEVDGRSLSEFLRVDLVSSLSKDPIEKFQMEFTEKTKELSDAMKAIRLRRDEDERAYGSTVERYKQRNADASKMLIREFEKELKRHIPRTLWSRPSEAKELSSDVVAVLEKRLHEVHHQLMEQEADQYDALESLNAGTIAKWKADAVDVILQTAFENFLKLEADFQVSLRQVFDTVFDMRQKQEHQADAYHHIKQDDAIMSVIESKEEYQKFLGDWFEVRRKRLEELEQIHIRSEERLLNERSARILNEEQYRHRNRMNEIHEFLQQMNSLIGSSCT
ncbi:putative Leucine rich repeat Leucine Rich repeats (2 copies) putativeeat [Trypanosoma vivax]|uniref:Dynein regulatory complex subunit 3 n=1 Tax=Trypanosoma vivax (strain Y486) TaxID=1055687 RepID=G0TXF3_TRYVY|nr:putative leucine-rich repeat protein [Trypanosoma vivax]KAH8614053.1 putative Leucine rich repeat Leucine Rich repeats (2 copies) putativeeat [Trypanosoma vivax]CCC48643.1 putative leucine-rich repeat protein [Trypanosoma vivax Y486]